jgi:uncharacterized membrane protein required for colicin V production
MPRVNQIDLAVLTLVLLFGYKGYRTGFIGFLLGLTGGLLAFALAAALAPLLAPVVTPLVSERLGVPSALVRPALVVVLTMGLRLVLGRAVRELAAVLGLVIRGVPPLALLDRLLGVVPSAALGGLLALALVLVALQLPTDVAGRRSVDDSWVAHNIIRQPEQTVGRLKALGERLIADPPRANGLVLGLSVAGLVLAGLTVARLGGPARTAAFHEAPTRRSRRGGSAPPVADAETSDPLALIRVTLGVGVALAMMAALVFLSNGR